MERHDLNIPTIYSHGIMIDDTNKKMLLSPSHYNYFWAIVYLYRNKLLDKKPNGLIPVTKNGKQRSKLNPKTTWDDISITIKFSEIKAVIKGENDGDHAKLKKFVFEQDLLPPLISTLQFKTNIFEKALTTKDHIVKPVKQIEPNKKGIDIVFTTDFIKPLLLTTKFFKKVPLNFMFWLPTTKSKILYLLMKDYDDFHKNFTKDEVQKMVGIIFDNNRDEQIFKYINEITDIYIDYDKCKFLEKTFTFNVSLQQRFINDDEEIEYMKKKLIGKEVNRRIEARIEDGKSVDNVDSYFKTVFGQLINNKEICHEYESMAILDLFIKKKKEELVDLVDSEKGFAYVSMNIELADDESKKFIIRNDYLLTEAYFMKAVNKSAEDTYYEILNDGKKTEAFITYLPKEIKEISKSLIKLT